MAQATGKREKRAAVPIFARHDASKPIDFDRILSLWDTASDLAVPAFHDPPKGFLRP